MCDENERKKRQPHKYFYDGRRIIRLYQKNGETDFNKLWDTVSALKEGNNSLVMFESKPYGWFVVCRCKTSAIKFAIAGSQD